MLSQSLPSAVTCLLRLYAPNAGTLSLSLEKGHCYYRHAFVLGFSFSIKDTSLWVYLFFSSLSIRAHTYRVGVVFVNLTVLKCMIMKCKPFFLIVFQQSKNLYLLSDNQYCKHKPHVALFF